MAVNKIKFWAPVLTCMGVIFYFSSIPGSNIPQLFTFQDVVFHLIIYFMLSSFFCRALKKSCSNLIPAKIVLLGAAFGSVYGLLDEIHQSFVPLRSMSGLDMFIDSVGSFAGSLIYRWLR